MKSVHPADGKVSAYIARAYLPALPTLSVLHSSEQVTVSWPTVDTARFTHYRGKHPDPLVLHPSWFPILTLSKAEKKLKYSRYFRQENVL